jgi:hypothetical protein
MSYDISDLIINELREGNTVAADRLTPLFS